MLKVTNWNYFRGLGIKMSIDELFSKFKVIRILSLSDCPGLEKLPNSICNLEHLRSLDLSSTTIKKTS